ncbi:MAG TPA: hypothetical protein VEV87_10455, partial [Chitinophagaceae bacterium]|nr:hypothetical protein [Chitinophagaceae bacterium]
MNCCRIIFLFLVCCSNTATAQKQILDSSMHHLRNGKEAEWVNFSRLPVQANLIIYFPANRNEADYTLSLNQNDVKQFWRLILNNRIIDSLVVDENPMKTFFSIPSGFLLQGNNELKIEPSSEINDDIEVGEIMLDERPINEVLTEAHLDIEVIDG